MQTSPLSLLTLVVVALMSVAPPLWAGTTPSRSAPGEPPAYIANVGQAAYVDGQPASHVDALLVGGSSTTYVHAGGMHVVLSKTGTEDGMPRVDLYRADITLVGSNRSARLEPGVRSEGWSRYILQGDSADGRIAVRYRKLVYRDVYPGIDQHLSVNDRGPKVDYIVHPGARPETIRLTYTGVTGLHVQEDGSLWMNTPICGIREAKPIAWTQQSDGSGRTPVEVSYVVDGTSVQFSVGTYDRSKTLVIDPQRMWATYYAGNGSFNSPMVAIDPTGNVYTAASTVARNLPRSVGVFQRAPRARLEAYIAKFSWDGQFVWNTYLGSSGADFIYDLVLDPNSNPWVCGSIDSNDHPLIDLDLAGSGPHGGLLGDTIIRRAGFVMRLTPQGAWGDSWIMDGREDDEVRAIAVSNTHVAMVGSTRSPRVNDVNGKPYTHHPANNTRQYDMFVSRLILKPGSTDRWTNDWLSYYGGEYDDFGNDVVLSSTGDVVAVGITQSDSVPVTNGSSFRGARDLYLVKFTTPTIYNPVRSWATYYGSSDFDYLGGMAIDAQGNPLVVGYTSGTDLPTVNALQGTIRGNLDGFIARFNSANGQTAYSSYFGGNQNDVINAISLDASGRLWIGGWTQLSTDLPVTNNAFQSEPYADDEWPLTDGWFAQLAPDARSVLYCTYYGAQPQPNLPPMPAPGDTNQPPPSTDFGFDQITSIHVDNNAYIATASLVQSLRFSTTPGAYQIGDTLKSDTVMMVTHLTVWSDCPDTAISIVLDGPTALCPGSQRTLLAPNGFAKYLWSTGATQRTIVAQDTGTYWVICTDVNGCRFRDTVVLTQSPVPVVSAGADTTGCLNQPIALTATPTSGLAPYRFKWRRLASGPSYINDDTLQIPSVNPPATSSYEVILTDSAGCTAVDTVVVTIINPQPTAAPSPVNFGEMGACESERFDSVVVTNPMPYAITIATFTADDPRLELVTSLNPPLSVAAGASRVLRLRISPTTEGTVNGTFALSGAPCSWTLTLPYTVTKAKASATIAPGTIDFGAGVNCEPLVRDSSTVIRNGGTEPLVVEPGVVAGPFSIVAPTTPTTVAPGETLRVSVRFEPMTDGAFSEVARFAYTTGDCQDTLRLTLRGARSSVGISAAPTTIDMGTLEGCEDERDTTITLSNTGSVDVTVTLPALPEVVFFPAGPITISAQGTQDVRVTVRPSAAGAFSFAPVLTAQPCDVSLPLSITGSKNGIAYTTPDVIAMGELNTCTDEPTITQQFSIAFNGTGSGTVASVNIGSSLATSLQAGVTLQSGQPQSFTLSWTPQADGAFIDSVVVVFQPCDVRRVIRVEGVRTTPALTAQTPAVNLGALTGDATGTIRYVNSGTDTLFVGALASANAIVVATRPSAIEALLPGSILEVDYRIVCSDVINDTITAVTLGDCVLEVATVFTGTCDGTPDASATVVIDDVTATVGQRIAVPIRLTSSAGLDANNLRTWEAEITYNPMVVVGTGSTPDCFVAGQYAPCTITITGTRTDSIGTLATLDLTAVLGTDVRTDLTLSRFVWLEDTTVAVQREDGSVTITDICLVDGPRLLDPKAEAFSIRVYPQPASQQVTLDVRGLGSQSGSWTLVTYLGQVVRDGALTPNADGNAVVALDVSTLSSGTYFLTINARGSVYRMPVIIQR